MSETRDPWIGEEVILDSPRYRGKYKVTNVYFKYGTRYFDLMDENGKVEDFPKSFLDSWRIKEEATKKDEVSVCNHEWRTDKWFINTYKTCSKCGAKWEELYGK